MPPGVSLRDVLQRQECLDARCECSLRVWEEPGVLVTEVLRHRIPDHLSYQEMYSAPRPPGRLLIGLGRGRRGALWVDLDSCPHLLVGGMTGGGKSVFLRQALTFLCREHGPEDLQVALIDLKGGVELAHFSYLPHSIYPVADSLLSAAETLERVRQELDRRLREVQEAASLERSAAPPSWPRLLVVVDEVAELTCRDLGDDRAARAAQQAASGRLGEIARLGRSVGVHLVCCTQRPDAEAVPGQLKANLQGTVAFRVRAAVNSYILLDSDRAAMLPPHPGRAIWQEETMEEFQAVDCSLEESRQLLLARWSGRVSIPPLVPVSQWWENTCPSSDDLPGPS
jgi:S-DNA-T family DNA segregation ATPase FtsK/SpoIIIE